MDVKYNPPRPTSFELKLYCSENRRFSSFGVNVFHDNSVSSSLHHKEIDFCISHLIRFTTTFSSFAVNGVHDNSVSIHHCNIWHQTSQVIRRYLHSYVS